MRPKTQISCFYRKHKGSDVMCNKILIKIKLFQLSFIIYTEKYLGKGFKIIRSERFRVVYINNCLNLALRLTLTNVEQKQTKGRPETKQKYEKEKRKCRFLPKWKDDLKWLETAY